MQITTEKPIILGVSFGGMLAIEIAKAIDCEQVILVSSAKTRLRLFCKETPNILSILKTRRVKAFLVKYSYINIIPYLSPIYRREKKNWESWKKPYICEWKLND